MTSRFASLNRPLIRYVGRVLSVGLLALAPLTAPVQAADYPTTERLRRFLASEWDWAMAQDPLFASAMGDRRWNSAWADQSQQAQRDRLSHQQQAWRQLREIPLARLTPEDRFHHQLYTRHLETWLKGDPLGAHAWVVTPLEGPQLDHTLVGLLKFDAERDFLDWIGRLRAFGVRVERTIDGLEGARKRGLVLDRGLAERVLTQLAPHQVKRPEESPFYQPLTRLPLDMPAERQHRLREEARQAIDRVVQPGIRRFERYWRNHYLPATHQETGLAALPGGDRLYEHLLNAHCTTRVTPALLHARGMAEVARLQQEMELIRLEVGFEGDLGEFLRQVERDPRFRHPNQAAALAEYDLLVRRLTQCLPSLFRVTNVPPCGVAAVPEAIAPTAPGGYYLPAATDGSRGGTFFVNLSNLAHRPAYEAAPLTLHEALPGHHLQFSRQFQRADWPTFRRLSRPSAFVEGWGLYAESLGEELGLYRDPYARFGRLNMSMRRALRVVLDTGLHAGGWERQRAIAFYRAHAARPEAEIVQEVDRFLADPGQAVAYKVGEWKFLELKARAIEGLGKRYDARDFHEAVLRDGAVPLDLLESRFDAWLRGSGGYLPAAPPARF
ncbi:MAG: DUF885 domain-containing protein [Candidatus Sericytochromatia bacterium]|nr:DUF885 domain-containing protein [Candidatus Sericytochromatia bacterium]